VATFLLADAIRENEGHEVVIATSGRDALSF
jgi:hypothetical protein